MIGIKTVKFLCSYLPPIMAQKFRDVLITVKQAEKLAIPFNRKSITGSYLAGNTNDFHAFKFYIHGYFDWRNIILTKKILSINPGDVIEVGANIGTETVSLTDIAKPNNVHAYEPVLSNFNSVKQCKESNGLTNLHVYQTLVSDTEGTASFNVPTGNNSGSGYITERGDENTQQFKQVTLDAHLSHLKSFSAILIDVEGFEYSVLNGGKSLISKFKPFIILEVNAKYLEKRAGISVLFLYNELSKMGYQSYYIGKLGLKKVAVEDFETRANKNWLCIPNEKSGNKSSLSNAILLNALNPFMKHKIF